MIAKLAPSFTLGEISKTCAGFLTIRLLAAKYNERAAAPMEQLAVFGITVCTQLVNDSTRP